MAVLLDVVPDRSLVKSVGFPFLDGYGSLGAFTQAGTKAIAVLVAHQSRLAINYLQGPVSTGRNADPTPAALLLIDPDDSSLKPAAKIVDDPVTDRGRLVNTFRRKHFE